jgi:hypothetical protein
MALQQYLHDRQFRPCHCDECFFRRSRPNCRGVDIQG